MKLSIDGATPEHRTVDQVSAAIRAALFENSNLTPVQKQVAMREIKRQAKARRGEIHVKIGDFELDVTKLSEAVMRSVPDTIEAVSTSSGSVYNDVLLEMREDGFRFISPGETIDLRESSKQFVTLKWSDIERATGRSIVPDEAGLPAGLTDRERNVVRIVAMTKRDILDNPSLSQKQKTRMVRDVFKARKQGIREGIRQKRVEAAKLHEDANKSQRCVDALRQIVAWLDSRTPRLQRPDGSQHGNLADAWREGEVLVPALDDMSQINRVFDGVNVPDAQVFVVQHNWAAALADATFDDGDGAGEVALPYELCCFEFTINDRRMCAIFQQDDTGMAMVPIVKTSVGWALLTPYKITDGWTAISAASSTVDSSEFTRLIVDNVRAISITLEAGVTETEVVRVPQKLNRARGRDGRAPLLDYHVVSLARRTRAAPLPAEMLDPDREVTRKRMHFRRGHWRHFQTHRTWIKWMLVGNADLGFVDKEYRL